MTNPPNAEGVTPFDAKAVVATLGAIAVGIYAGIHFVIPTAFAVALMLITTKLFPDNRRRYVVLFSLQAAHALWLCLALLTPTAQAVIVDIVLIGALLTWLMMRPGTAPLYVLAIYQLVSLYANATGLLVAEVNTPAHKALTVHVLYRVLALTYIAIALVSLHQDARSNAASG